MQGNSRETGAEESANVITCKTSQLSFPQAKRVGNPSDSPLEKGEKGGCSERFRPSRNDRLTTECGFNNDCLKIRVATPQDIPTLKKMVRGLFPDSRFYNDPFFSKREADRLYQAWIENSVKAEAADIVFCVPETGFITCRRSTEKTGEIVLLGIKKNLRGKGFGSALARAAMQWFAEEKVKNVTVRTQLRNLKALNFYLARGFSPKSYDIILAKIFEKRR